MHHHPWNQERVINLSTCPCLLSSGWSSFSFFPPKILCWSYLYRSYLGETLNYLSYPPSALNTSTEMWEHGWLFIPLSDWKFIGRTVAEGAAPILWPTAVKSQLIRKDPDAGKDWGQEEKEMTEDEMVGWHHWLNGHELEQPPRDSEGQGSLVGCSPWGHKESDVTEWPNNNPDQRRCKLLQESDSYPKEKLRSFSSPFPLFYLFPPSGSTRKQNG